MFMFVYNIQGRIAFWNEVLYEKCHRIWQEIIIIIILMSSNRVLLESCELFTIQIPEMLGRFFKIWIKWKLKEFQIIWANILFTIEHR